MTFQNGLGRGQDWKLMHWSIWVRLERRQQKKAGKTFNFSTTALCKVKPVMAWQDLYVSGNEGHRDEKKNLGQCELVGCQEGAMQLKSWLAAEAHVCPECRAGTLLGKKNKRSYYICLGISKYYFMWRELWEWGTEKLGCKNKKGCCDLPGGLSGVWYAALVSSRCKTRLPYSQRSWV